MKHGALWAKEWRDGVTHVIADKSLCYNDLITHLKISSLPVSALTKFPSNWRLTVQVDVVLVNEDYPADCIKYQSLVNPDQPQYHLDGQKPALNTDEVRFPFPPLLVLS